MADDLRAQGNALRAETAEAIEAYIARLERERRSPVPKAVEPEAKR